MSLKEKAVFTKESPITIVPKNNDELNVQGKLEHLLINKGFDVISEAVAQERLNFQSESDVGVAAKNKSVGTELGTAIIRKSSSGHSVSRVIEIRAPYVLRFHYLAYHDLFYWAFTSFSATVIDLTNGEIVASANFFGDKSVESVLKEFANKLADLVK